MTQLVSDIRILDNLLALNLNVSLWSARRKMSQEDLGSAELPPEDLASLGSKRIADPENLKVFGTLKARAFNYLDRHGVPCAIVTASFSIIMDAVRTRLPHSVRYIVTSDLVANAKPHPEPYQTAADLLRVDPRDTVALEDSLPGATSAVQLRAI